MVLEVPIDRADRVGSVRDRIHVGALQDGLAETLNLLGAVDRQFLQREDFFGRAGYLAGGETPEMEGNALNGGSYYGYYETSDGRWMSVGSIEPHFLEALCDAFGVPVPGGRGLGLDPESDRQFKELLQEKFAAKTFSECRALFAGFDACVEPVLNIEEAFEHSLFKAREMIADVPGPDGGRQKQMAAAIRFSGSEARYKHIGTPVGEHTHDVLRAMGKADAEIARLEKEGCFS